jgi:glutamate racemase
MDNKAIGIFDSGVGGLTVLAEIRKNLPNENIIYLGDTKNFPYGNRSKEEIIEFAIQNVETLIKKQVKIIVIACGTATSQALDVVKDKFDIPIIGIIEPTVQYIENQKYDELGVIATEGTIRSRAWEQKLKEKVPDIKVTNKACPMLATIAEEGKAQSPEGRKVIKEYMEPFKEKHIDKIILGCTHYPIYEKIIREELGYEVELINTGVTVSKYLQKYLKQNNLENNETSKTEKIFLTKPEKEFKKIAKNILNENLDIQAI